MRPIGASVSPSVAELKRNTAVREDIRFMSSTQTRPSAFVRNRRPIYAAAAAAIALPLMFTSTSPAYAQAAPPADAIDAIVSGDLLPDYQNDYLDQVVSENIWANDVKLSDEIGPRLRGTAAEMEAVQWVNDTFASYGMQTKIEEFPVTAQLYADVVPSRYTDEYASWQFRPATNGRLTGTTAPVTGQLVDVGATTTGLATRTDLAGKIVLADWIATSATRTQVLKDLKAAGVAAVVLTNVGTAESLPNVGNLDSTLTDMVVVGSATNQGKRMRTLLAGGDLSLTITTERGSATSHNAIGILPAASGDPDAPIIYLGAHIDSVLGSPGASDNGSGVSIMLEVARIMSQYEYDAEIRFGAWGAEESGYQGSNYHVKTVMTVEEQKRTLGAWNMDMAGTGHLGDAGKEFKFWALTADTNRLPLAPSESPVLDFSNQVSNLSGNGDLPIGTVSRSDHQPFHDVGIKAAVFSWMHWAGGTNIILEPAYHMTTDTLEFVSEERMGHAARILGGGAFRAALNSASVVVTDAGDAPVAGAQVVMSCGDDDGWRDAGITDAEGKISTLAPTTTCDFVALTDNGARGLAADIAVKSADVAATAPDVAVAIKLEAITAPVVSFSTSPAASTSGWLLATPATVNVTASNNFGDDIKLEYSLDGTTWQPYTAGVALAGEGEQTLQVRADGGFGTTAEASFTAKVDSISPEITVAVDDAKRGFVSGSASDATSGVALVQYRINGGQWVDVATSSAGGGVAARAAFAAAAPTPATFSVELPLGNAAATAQFRAIDTAGNITEGATLKFAAVATATTPAETTPAATTTAPGEDLANTGAESGAPSGILAAVILLLTGGLILIARKRSHRVSDEA